MLKEFQTTTSKEQEIVDITDKIKKIVRDSGVEQGLCLIYVPHATAGIIINENYDPLVCADIINKLEELIPSSGDYEHNKIDNNAHAHIKASLIGPSEVIPIANGELQLGRWQGCGFLELDGPKDRRVIVMVLEDN